MFAVAKCPMIPRPEKVAVELGVHRMPPFPDDTVPVTTASTFVGGVFALAAVSPNAPMDRARPPPIAAAVTRRIADFMPFLSLVRP
jgi:hypothetical protein